MKFMYKTTVYTLVNGEITHPNQQVLGKGYITPHYITCMSMLC